jgi:hypothetical protein
MAEWEGLKRIADLPVQPMNKEIMKMLKKRGKLFKQISLGHHYKQYQGYMFYQRQWHTAVFKADGRVMVDVTTFQKMNPEYGEFKDPAGINQVNYDYDYNQMYNPYGQQNQKPGTMSGIPTTF